MNFTVTSIYDHWLRLAHYPDHTKPVLVNRDSILAITPLFEIDYQDIDGVEDVEVKTEVGAIIQLEDDIRIQVANTVAEIEKVLFAEK